MRTEIAIDIHFLQSCGRTEFEAVRHQKAFIAEQRCKPVQLLKQPRVVNDDVVFQITEIIELIEVLPQDFVARESKHVRLYLNAPMRYHSFKGADGAHQVPTTGCQYDDLQSRLDCLIGRDRRTLMNVDHSLFWSDELVERRNRGNQPLQAH